MKNLLLLPFFVLSFLFTSVLFADSDDSHRCKWDKIASQLNLTSDQQEKIKGLKESAKSNLMSLKQQIQSVKEEMKTLSMSATLDQSKVDALIEKANSVWGQMMKAKITLRNQIYNILTPEQQQKLQSLMSQQMQDKDGDNDSSC